MRPLPLLFVLLSAVLAAGAANAADLPTATPEQVGLSSSRLARISRDAEGGRRARAHSRRRRDRGSQGPHRLRRGRRLPRQDGRRADDAGRDLPDRVDDQADGVGRGDDALRGRPALRQRSRLEVHPGARQAAGRRRALDPVTGKSVLALVPADREMTIQDLLRHTSGPHLRQPRHDADPQGVPERSSSAASRELTTEEFIARLAQGPAPLPAGHDVGVRLLDRRAGPRRRGRVRQAARRQFLAERIFQPLKMTDTAFRGPGRQAGAPRPAARDRSRHGQGDHAVRSRRAAEVRVRRRLRGRRPPATTCASPRCCSTAARSTARACSAARPSST